MSAPHEFFQGEFVRTLDDRFRLSIPAELAEPLSASDAKLMLVKERPGCLSLWPAARWNARLQTTVELLHAKLKAGKLDARLSQVQSLGRLLSTRHREVQLAGRGRVLIPEGFREFLHVEAAGEAIIVGAAVCVEIWNPADWRNHLDVQLPSFEQLIDELTG